MANNNERIKALQEGLRAAEQSISELKSSTEQLVETHRSLKEAAAYLETVLPEIRAKVEEVRGIKESADSSLKEIKEQQTEAGNALSNIQEASDEVLGAEFDDGSTSPGIRAELETVLEDTRAERVRQQEEFSALMKKVNDLLPGATSAGLADAYRSQKRSFAISGVVWPTIFILAVSGIVVIGAMSFADVQDITSIEVVTAKLLARLPFYLALVWLAQFASKQQSQSKRLAQEYAHKETVSRSLEGYKREINELEGDASASVMKNFMDHVVDTIGFNPSSTLDKNHGDTRSPIATILDALSRRKGPVNEGDRNE